MDSGKGSFSWPSPTQWLDITPPISENLAVFPGDTPFKLHWCQRFEGTSTYSLSAITMSSHLGAHADAPYHYLPQGQSIEERPLEYYLGPCQVLDLTSASGGISVAELQGHKISAQRVLLKTNSFPNWNHWQDEFRYLTAAAIDFLFKARVLTVGIDTPSIDPATSKDLPAHAAIASHDMAILEGLDLRKVSSGNYLLIALPLRLIGAEASPVRAILAPLDPKSI